MDEVSKGAGTQGVPPQPKPQAAAAVSSTKEFNAVFQAELAAIRERHNRFAGPTENIPDTGGADRQPSTDLGLTGLACSGGGIRSAAFCLGVLQGLQSAEVIDRIDFLSTVSGGGYIGATLSIGMATGPDARPNQPEARFPFGRLADEDRESAEVKHLRDNSRYLLQDGLVSLIPAAVIYLRGLTMNTLVILPLLLVVAAALLAFGISEGFIIKRLGLIRLPLTALGAVLIVVGLVYYAVAVSIWRLLPLTERRRFARKAAILFAVILGLSLVELHAALLGLMLEGANKAQAGQGGAGVFGSSYRAIQDAVTFLSPLVLAVLPFWKTLAEKASTEAAGWQDILKQIASRVVLLLAAAVVPMLLWLVMMQLAFWGTAIPVVCNATGCPPGYGWLPDLLRTVASCVPSLGRFSIPLFYIVLSLPLLASWRFLNVNSNSLHQLYRDRLGSAFLIRRRAANGKGTDAEPGELVTADDFPLTRLDPRRGPYHIINTALNVPGSRFANRRGRNADFFIFSKCFVGSEITGYVDTYKAEKVVDGLNVGTAVAISGAAAAPNMGLVSIRPLSATIALLNVRLGRWVLHPFDIDRTFPVACAKEAAATQADNASAPRRRLVTWRYPGPVYLLFEAFFKSGRNVMANSNGRNDRGFVFLSDGGHIENLGIYELLRRRCKLIIAIDGEADPNIDGPSLTQLERLARIDYNIAIRMQWKPIGELTRAVASSAAKEPQHGPHVALGLIDYPPSSPGGARETGVLVYIKASLSGDENDYVLAYNARHKTFPHETTADQLFSEEQFEVYRALGEHIAIGFVTGRDPVSVDPKNAKVLIDMVNETLKIQGPAA